MTKTPLRGKELQIASIRSRSETRSTRASRCPRSPTLPKVTDDALTPGQER